MDFIREDTFSGGFGIRVSALLGRPPRGHFNSKSSGKSALPYEIHVLIEEKVSESLAAIISATMDNEYSRAATSPGSMEHEHIFFWFSFFLVVIWETSIKDGPVLHNTD